MKMAPLEDRFINVFLRIRIRNSFCLSISFVLSVFQGILIHAWLTHLHFPKPSRSHLDSMKHPFYQTACAVSENTKKKTQYFRQNKTYYNGNTNSYPNVLFSLVWQTRPQVQHRSFCIKINGHTDLWSCVLLVSQLTSSGRSSEKFQSTHTLRLFVFSIKAFTSTASSIKCPVLCSRTLPSPAQLYRFSVSPSPTIKRKREKHFQKLATQHARSSIISAEINPEDIYLNLTSTQVSENSSLA